MTEASRTRYIIVGMQRSGTTVTHYCLYGHPNVCAMVDEFRVSPFFTEGVCTFTVGGKNMWERRHGYHQLFDAVTLYRAGSENQIFAYGGNEQHPKGDIRANGMKIAVPRIEDARNLVQALQDYFPDIKVVYVQREDWLAQYASLLRAQRSGRWHSWTKVENEQAADAVRIEIDKNHFDAYIQQAMATEEAFSSLRDTHEFCTVSYDADIDGDPLGGAHKLFDFVGVPRVEPVWVNSKKVAPPIEDFVVDHAAWRAHLEDRRTNGFPAASDEE